MAYIWSENILNINNMNLSCELQKQFKIKRNSCPFHLDGQRYQSYDPYHCWLHSRPQRPRSFWSAPRIATSGRPLALWPCPTPEVRDSRTSCHSAQAQSQVWQTSDKPDWFWSQSTLCLQIHSKPECRWTRPEVARPKGARPLGTRMCWLHSRPQSFPRALVAVSHVIKDKSSGVENGVDYRVSICACPFQC